MATAEQTPVHDSPGKKRVLRGKEDDHLSHRPFKRQRCESTDGVNEEIKTNIECDFSQPFHPSHPFEIKVIQGGFIFSHPDLSVPEFVEHSCIHHDLLQLQLDCATMDQKTFQSNLKKDQRKKCGCLGLVAVWCNRSDLIKLLPAKYNIQLASKFALFLRHGDCFQLLANRIKLTECHFMDNTTYAFNISHAELLIHTYGCIESIKYIVYNLETAFEFFWDKIGIDLKDFHSYIQHLMELAIVFFPGSEVSSWSICSWLSLATYCVRNQLPWITSLHTELWKLFQAFDSFSSSPSSASLEVIQGTMKIKIYCEHAERIQQHFASEDVVQHPNSPILSELPRSFIFQLWQDAHGNHFAWKEQMFSWFTHYQHHQHHQHQQHILQHHQHQHHS